mgnify:CR=1 FL=1
MGERLEVVAVLGDRRAAGDARGAVVEDRAVSDVGQAEQLLIRRHRVDLVSEVLDDDVRPIDERSRCPQQAGGLLGGNPNADANRARVNAINQELMGRGIKSPEFRSFFAAIQPYVKDIEEMRHYARTDVRWTRA